MWLPSSPCLPLTLTVGLMCLPRSSPSPTWAHPSLPQHRVTPRGLQGQARGQREEGDRVASQRRSLRPDGCTQGRGPASWTFQVAVLQL